MASEATPAVETSCRPIDRLRSVMEQVRQGKPIRPSDAAWLLKACHTYVENPSGCRLDVELGLQPRWSESGWWTLEARDARDALIIDLDRQMYSDMDLTTSAKTIVAIAFDGRTSGGAALPPIEAEFVQQMLRTGRHVPGFRQVKNILSKARGNRYPAQISRHEFPRGSADSSI